jgi:hypothetical protein
MSTCTGTSPIQKRLSYNSGSWHDVTDAKAEQNRLIDKVLVGLDSLSAVVSNIEMWREAVFTGEAEFSAATDERYRAVLSNWVDVTEQNVLPRIEAVEAVMGFNAVSGSAALRQGLLKARHMLQTWKAPALSTAVAFRMEHLTEDEAAKVFTALRENSARPTRPPRRIAGG